MEHGETGSTPIFEELLVLSTWKVVWDWVLMYEFMRK